jgi:hypothetical protein
MKLRRAVVRGIPQPVFPLFGISLVTKIGCDGYSFAGEICRDGSVMVILQLENILINGP